MSGLLAWGSRSSGRDSTWTISGTACSGQPARRLLESTDDPIETVALRAGNETSTAMRAKFSLRLQTSPRGYRSTFRG